MNFLRGWISTKRAPGCVQWDREKDHVTFYRGLVLLRKDECKKVRDPLKRVTKLVDPKDENKLLGFRVYRVSELLASRGKRLDTLDGWQILDMALDEAKRLYNKGTIGHHLCMEQDKSLKDIREGMVGFMLTISGNVR